MKRGFVYCLLFLMLVVFGFGLHGWKSKLSGPTPTERVEQSHKDVFVCTPSQYEAGECEPITPAVKPPEWQCVGPKDTRSTNCYLLETPKEKLLATPRVRSTHRPHAARPVPQSRPLDRKAPVEALPPQLPVNRLTCLFPFNLVPSCYVDAS